MRHVNGLSTLSCHSELTVQAGTPMTVAGNGTRFLPESGVPIFCPQVSWGVNAKQRGATPPFFARRGGE